MPRITEPREEDIESDICEFLTLKGASLDKIVMEWYYDQNKWIYRQRKSRYTNRGIADIIGCYQGIYFAIEVKKPSEMKFFNRETKEIMEDCIKAQTRNLSGATLRKYHHAVEQSAFLDDKIRAGGVAFFASSIQEVKDEFKNFNIIL